MDVSQELCFSQVVSFGDAGLFRGARKSPSVPCGQRMGRGQALATRDPARTQVCCALPAWHRLWLCPLAVFHHELSVLGSPTQHGV